MKKKSYEGPKLECILGEELPVADLEPKRTEKEVVSSSHSKQEE